jgi:hypothetical protein
MLSYTYAKGFVKCLEEGGKLGHNLGACKEIANLTFGEDVLETRAVKDKVYIRFTDRSAVECSPTEAGERFVAMDPPAPPTYH